MHYKIGMVVLFGTALRAMFTLFDKFDFEQMIFIVDNSFRGKNGAPYILIYK